MDTGSLHTGEEQVTQFHLATFLGISLHDAVLN
jgi:hypothetical protein